VDQQVQFQPAGDMQIARCYAVHQFGRSTTGGEELDGILMRVELDLANPIPPDLGAYYGIVLLQPVPGSGGLVLPDNATVLDLNGKKLT
jgi:hypothetical protein